MNEFDVMSFRRKPKEKKNTILCCEARNGNRFIVKQIEVKGTDVTAKLSDGTSAKPDVLSVIYEFSNVADAQSFLLNR
ncbi:MAG: hypothetical protein M3367_15685 [Acidobacteriota bacterium]|nr:hypothetical protein [Acidobacteriota bacterium]